jgi:hypothetical protein
MTRKEYMKIYHAAWYQANKIRLDEINKKWVKENPDRSRAIKAAWDKRNPEKVKEKNTAWNKANPEKVKAAQAKYVNAHPEKTRTRKNKWNQSHPEKARIRTAEWNKINPERRKLLQENYRKENVGKIRTYQVVRKAGSDRATPLWANKFYIDEIYRLAKLRTKIMGFDWHVDHIVPLQSKLVCGLHCETNLCVIPAKQNQIKGNRYWPDMPK